MCGQDLRSVQMHSKLNRSLNASSLRREMVYFPCCDMDFYKKLTAQKEAQDERLLRLRECSA